MYVPGVRRARVRVVIRAFFFVSTRSIDAFPEKEQRRAFFLCLDGRAPEKDANAPTAVRRGRERANDRSISIDGDDDDPRAFLNGSTRRSD